MDYLPPTPHLFGGKLNGFVVVTTSLLVEGGVVFFAGFGIDLAATASAGDGAGTTFFRFCALFVPVQTSFADFTPAETRALFTLVFFRLTGGTGTFQLLVHEFTRVVFNGLTELDFGVEEAVAVFVERGSLEGSAGGRRFREGWFGGGRVFDHGCGCVGGLSFFGHGWDRCYFAHCSR